jgi:hypothetical protein
MYVVPAVPTFRTEHRIRLTIASEATSYMPNGARLGIPAPCSTPSSAERSIGFHDGLPARCMLTLTLGDKSQPYPAHARRGEASHSQWGEQSHSHHALYVKSNSRRGGGGVARLSCQGMPKSCNP